MPSPQLNQLVHILKAVGQAGITRTIRSLVLALLVIAVANASAQAQPGGPRGGRGGGGFGGFGGGFGGFGFGGGGFGNSFSSLLRDPAIKLEIQLTPEQEEEIRKVTEAGGGREAMQARFAAIQEAETDEEKDKIRKDMAADLEKRTKEQDAAIKKLLKSEQATRLEQIQLQRNGLSGLTKNDTLSQSLKITEEQKKKFLEIQAEYDKKVAEMRNVDYRSMSREEREKNGEDQLQARTDRDAQLEQVLTAEQKASWEAKQGTPAPKFDRGGPGGGGRGGSRDRTVAVGAAPGSPRGPVREEKVPDGTVAVADFTAPSEAPMGTETAADKGTDKVAEKSVASTEKLMSFTFRFAPWDLVLKKFADHAGLTLDLNVVPVGTFNYYDDGKYTVTEALDILNGYLLQKGYILVRRDKFLVVVTVDNIEPNLVPDVSYADLNKRGRNELVRVILPIDGMSTETAADEAQKLLGPQGELIPLSKSGRLVVTDLASNVRRIHDLLNGMNAIPTNGPTFQSFQLKHVSVMEAEKVVRDLFGLPQRGVISTPVANSSVTNSQQSSSRFGDFGRGDFGRGDFGRGDFGRGDFRRGDFGRGEFGGRDFGRSQQPPQTQTSTSNSNVASNSSISVATDLRTNTLMVTAKPDDLKIVEQAIKTLDIDEKTNNQSRNLTGRNSPQLEVYAITTADPRVMIQTINNLVPSAIVNEDAKAKRLHVFATADEQLQIKALIHQIDGGVEGGETALVVQLRRLDPMGAAGSLRNLFKGNRDDNIPMIEADPIGKRLMIRGTTAQMTEIRQLLKQMGEDPDGTGLPDPSLRGPIRTLSLGGRDPQEFAELIEKLWPGRDSNPIRIVVPSAGNQTLKSGSHHELDAASSRNAPQSANPKRSESVIKTKVTTPIKVNADAIPPTSEKDVGAILEEVGELLEGKTVDDQLEEATADDAAVNDVKQTSPVDPTEIQPADETASGKVDPLETKTESSTKVEPKPAAPALVAPKASNPAPATTESTTRKPPAAEPATAEPAAKSAPKENEATGPAQPRSGRNMPQKNGDTAGKPVTVFPSGSNLVISSEDLDALDRIQALVEALAQASPKRQTWTVFYLRTADATETATMLGHLFPSGSVSQTTDPNSQTMMGSLTGGISSMGSSLMDMTGLSSLGAASALRIVPEIRSNALYVSGPADLVHQVEDVLKVLDASELPESLRERVPRMIPVEHADVDEVAAIIESLYKDYMQAPAAMPGGGGGGGLNPLALLMAASGGGDKQKGRGIRLTIGVDARTSSVVVSADEALYRQIEALVQTLDQKALEANRTIRIISVDATRALLVQQALGSLTGKVKVSSTRGGPAQAVTPDESPAPSVPAGGSSRTSRSPRTGDSGNAAEDELRRRFLQGAGIFPGGDNNGGNNGGGRGGRGGFGGGRPRGQ